MSIKVIRETLEDGTFRYVLLRDGHVMHFVKAEREFTSAYVFNKRIVGLSTHDTDRIYNSEMFNESQLIKVEVSTEVTL
jgi:hypothetical protein